MNEIANLTLIGLSQISQLPACCVLYLILVAFWKNRRTHYGAESWYRLLRKLNLSFVNELITRKYYKRKPKYVKLVVLFLFLCWLFEITHRELYDFLKRNRDRFWFRFLPVHDRFLRTVSEFLGASGQNVKTSDLKLCFEKIIEQIFEIVCVGQLTDEDLFNYSCYFTFRGKSSMDLPSDAKGGHYFANFIFSLGVGAALSLCQKGNDEAQERLLCGFGYSTTQLVCAILSTLGNKNITQLAKELRNQGDFYEGIRPSAQVLAKFIKDLDKDKVVSFYERFVKGVRQFKRLSKIVVAIDATIIVHYAQQVAGKKNVQFTLFDRGYFDTQDFAKLDDEGSKFVTMGKKCKTFKEIIHYLENDMSLYEHVEENEWRVNFYLCNFINFTSDECFRWIRVTIRRKLVARTKRDAKTGETINETRLEYLIYMTNILDGAVEDIVKTYGQRVAIENSFEELKNAYRIKGFPTTSYDVVVVYITLILIAHLLLWLFCSLLSTPEAERPYCNKELSTLKLDLIERPVEEIFDFGESEEPEIAKIQKAIERDIAFIKKFKRFIQKTKKRHTRVSMLRSIQV